jgi:hypothetical protein
MNIYNRTYSKDHEHNEREIDANVTPISVQFARGIWH